MYFNLHFCFFLFIPKLCINFIRKANNSRLSLKIIMQTDLAAASSSIPLPNMRFSCRFSPSVAAETWTSNLSSKQWILHSTAQIENIITSNEDQSMWEACKQALSAFNFSDEEKDKILGNGWFMWND